MRHQASYEERERDGGATCTNSQLQAIWKCLLKHTSFNLRYWGAVVTLYFVTAIDLASLEACPRPGNDLRILKKKSNLSLVGKTWLLDIPLQLSDGKPKL